jgi:hypothetical protein
MILIQFVSGYAGGYKDYTADYESDQLQIVQDLFQKRMQGGVGLAFDLLHKLRLDGILLILGVHATSRDLRLNYWLGYFSRYSCITLLQRQAISFKVICCKGQKESAGFGSIH